MKSQAELLHGTNIPTDDLGIGFTPVQDQLLAVAEGFAFNEWSRASRYLGLAATIDAVPENFELTVQRAGRWTKDYPTLTDLEK